ncbi:hypothetical protein SeMB42_g00917 [Synchytrium endobioticum]|uniref:Uncharacterized protein n=1 Tax=Synchytrium endobioticum TaxID=286115 RepID=A0A507DNG0_9FUNG|nr:hypothetical protein SeMB42_g00917 [Synchytrium endobioticum]
MQQNAHASLDIYVPKLQAYDAQTLSNSGILLNVLSILDTLITAPPFTGSESSSQLELLSPNPEIWGTTGSAPTLVLLAFPQGFVGEEAEDEMGVTNDAVGTLLYIALLFALYNGGLESVGLLCGTWSSGTGLHCLALLLLLFSVRLGASKDGALDDTAFELFPVANVLRLLLVPNISYAFAK